MSSDSNHHILSGLTNNLQDADVQETQEWIESFDALIQAQGTARAQYVMRALLQHAGTHSVGVPMVTTSDYVNTIPVDQEPEFPGDEEIERRYRAFLRWNAAVMVHRAQRPEVSVGGHISSYAGVAAAAWPMGADTSTAPIQRKSGNTIGSHFHLPAAAKPNPRPARKKSR